jgi:predicted nucleic acid-binding protein
VRFWDASAIVPLIVSESSSKALMRLLDEDPGMIVWWATPVECASAIARCERDAAMSAAEAGTALDRLRELSSAWHEVQPVEPVRVLAQRLLRVHALRSADSLQLGAAIVAAEHEPSAFEFVSLDERLGEAASREGFRIISP